MGQKVERQPRQISYFWLFLVSRAFLVLLYPVLKTKMTSSYLLRSFVLIMVIAIDVVLSGHRRIKRDKAQNGQTSISDADLIKCLGIVASGGNCDFLDAPTPSPPPPSVRNLTDEDLVKCLLTVSEGGNCDFLDSQPLPPACSCTKRFMCPDVAVTASNGKCSDPSDVCCKDTNSPFSPDCGRTRGQANAPADRFSNFGQFPWMAGILRKGFLDGSDLFLCGGSLIHPRVILTAAHKLEVEDPQDLVVRLGEWDFKEATEVLSHQDIQVQRIAIHEEFWPGQFLYDVALLFLEKEAVLGPSVDTICLPDTSEEFDGASCYLSGWGKDNARGNYQRVLKSVQQSMVDNPQCQKEFQRTFLGSHFELHNSFVCARGQGGYHACEGDGGSPLVCPAASDPTRYLQVGVAVWGIQCGNLGTPAGYASVQAAMPWIARELR